PRNQGYCDISLPARGGSSISTRTPYASLPISSAARSSRRWYAPGRGCVCRALGIRSSSQSEPSSASRSAYERQRRSAGDCALPGIGPWTTQYVAMRALAERDAFPAGDLGLRRALGERDQPISAKASERISENWRPWRAYVALYLWTSPGVAHMRAKR